MKNSGFTLIEMIVAIGIFGLVVTITTSAFININDLLKKAEAHRAVVDNLNFAIEAMLREIRAGKSFAGGNGFFTFTNSSNKEIEYSLSDKKIKRGEEDSDEFYLTASEVEITGLKFIVTGNDPGDDKQPKVTIIINGEIQNPRGASEKLNIQTTVSQRKMDS